MAKSNLAGDTAIFERMLARRSAPEVPAAVTNIREALGITEVTHPREVAEKFLAEILPAREVTKLPEVHDPAGDDLQFHIPAGRATQVMGTREIDISRYPNDLDPLVTDTRRRALPARSAIARAKELEDILAGDEKLQKLMRKWDVKRFSVRLSR